MVNGVASRGLSPAFSLDFFGLYVSSQGFFDQCFLTVISAMFLNHRCICSNKNLITSKFVLQKKTIV